MMQTGVQIAGSAASPPILTKGVVAVPEPLTSEILTQTVLQVQEGGLPVLNHQDAWRVTPDLMAAMERLMAIVAWVRSPAGGWSQGRVVDSETLLPYVMDEALDVLDCLEKSWLHPGLPAHHPFAPLQKLLNDRLILSDAISQLLWGVARSSVETMQLLGGIPAELFQAGKEWTPGILRLMAVLTVQTPNFQWQMDLVTAAPPLPELHPDSLLRWSNSVVFWAEGLLQTLQNTIAQNTLPLQNLLTQAVPSEIIAPGQPWQKGTLHLSLGFTFAPHATKPVLSVLPSTLAVAEPPKPDWEEYRFSALNPEGIAGVPSLPTELPPKSPRDAVPTSSDQNDSAPIGETLTLEAVETLSSPRSPQTMTETEALFDEHWFGAPSPEIEGLAQEMVADLETPQITQGGAMDLGNTDFGEHDLFGDFGELGGDTPNPLETLGSGDLFDGWGDLSTGAPSDRPGVQPEKSNVDLVQPHLEPEPNLQLESNLEPNAEPDFEIVLDATLLEAPYIGSISEQPSQQVSEDASKDYNLAEVVVDDAENWNLEQWMIRWSSENTALESDRLQLPRSYHVKTLLHRLGSAGKVTQPSLNKEHHLVEIVDLACEALKLPDPPPTLLNTDFVPPESSLATLVNRLTWELIRNSYGLTCLLSGIPAQILQPEWGWESGVLRLLPILKVLDLQVDLGTGAPAPLETILLLPDILVSIEGSDWQQTRESAVEFRSGLLKQIYQLLPELEVLCCPVPVEVATAHSLWQPTTLHLQFELGFQGN